MRTSKFYYENFQNSLQYPSQASEYIRYMDTNILLAREQGRYQISYYLRDLTRESLDWLALYYTSLKCTCKVDKDLSLTISFSDEYFDIPSKCMGIVNFFRELKQSLLG